MIWKIHYNDDAIKDLVIIGDYISNILMAPDAAMKTVDGIRRAIRKLDKMPRRHRLYEVEPWEDFGIRFFPVKKYIVLYMVDEDAQSVEILRIIYSGRDLKRQLEETE